MNTLECVFCVAHVQLLCMLLILVHVCVCFLFSPGSLLCGVVRVRVFYDDVLLCIHCLLLVVHSVSCVRWLVHLCLLVLV